MGLMDLLLGNSDDNTYGYKSFKNKYGWDNTKMLEILQGEDTKYGIPKMGWIRAFGKEREVIVYNQVNKVNYIYVDAQPKKIIVSQAPKPGQVGGAIDHVDNTEDLSETEENFVDATVDTIDATNEMIKMVKGILEREW